MIRIDQLLAGFAEGDAISHEAVLLQEIFRSWGFQSDIFVNPNFASPAMAGKYRKLKEYTATREDICVYHHSIASESEDFFRATPARKIMIYHNITPEEFFKPFDERIYNQLKTAREKLPQIAKFASAIWADSFFNASELIALGIKNVQILKLPFYQKQFSIPPDPNVLKKFSGEKITTILFVGRIAPNKKIENLIEAFSYYHKTINPFSRLLLVGSYHALPKYMAALRMLIGDYDLPNVCFEGYASPAGLNAYYRVADLYLSTSQHEGYGLTLVEAMYAGLPVVARNTGGVQEAMDNAGVLFEDLTAAQLAELINLVLTDDELRAKIIASQKERIERELKRNISAEVKSLLTGWL